MNNPVYITIEGSKQGLMTAGSTTPDSVGNAYQNGHEDESLVKAFSHNVKIPTDESSGQPTGRRTHQPMVITKSIDKSSPLLFNALVDGEPLGNVELKWYRPSISGKQELYYSMKLSNAIIVNIETLMGQEEGMFSPLENVSFSYSKIELLHTICTTAGEDDWQAGMKL